MDTSTIDQNYQQLRQQVPQYQQVHYQPALQQMGGGMFGGGGGGGMLGGLLNSGFGARWRSEPASGSAKI